MSGLKEKNAKKSNAFFKGSAKFVKTFAGMVKGGKAPAVDPQQPPKEQKSPLLHKNPSSDAEPMQDTYVFRQGGAAPTHYVETGVQDSSVTPPLVIRMSNGKTVDHPDTVKSHGPVEFSTSPATSSWSPSTSGYSTGPYPRSTDRRPGYDSAGYTSRSTDHDPAGPRRHLESAQQTATYDSLLVEAQILRRDLESAYTQNLESKNDLTQEIELRKIKISSVESNKTSADMFDGIISDLSKDLTDLQNKVKAIEARMYPLRWAIHDLQEVESFITARELDSDGALHVFEEIMRKLFNDVSLGGMMSGETNLRHPGQLPPTVLEEMKDKISRDTLKKTAPRLTEIGAGSEWADFEDDTEPREKLTSTGAHEGNIRKRLNRLGFQRVSQKLSDITEFTHRKMKKGPGRTEAFKFSAVERADAFKNISYKVPADALEWKEGGGGSVAASATSDHKHTADVLESMGNEAWMGYNVGTGLTPPPSEVPESLKSSRSVTDLQGLDLFQGASLGVHVSGDDYWKKLPPNASPLEQSSSQEGAGRVMTPGGSEGGQPGTGGDLLSAELTLAEPTAEASEEQDVTSATKKKLSEESPPQEPTVEEKPAAEEKSSMSQALAQVQLKKASEGPQTPPPAMLGDLDAIDGAMLLASVLGPGSGAKQADGGVKLALAVDEPPPTPEKKVVERPPPVAKKAAPPPPPKKGAPPPPPPPPKKGAPPPPPGKKAGAKGGGPPPPPKGGRRAADGLQRAPEVITMFQEMRKALLGNAAKGDGGPKKIGGGTADPAALMEELSKNSKYAAQVQADVINYGPLIQDLIKEVSGFVASDMKDIVEFVKRVDAFLAELSDETAVLKQFDWPARYYTMLEARGQYEELEKMKTTLKSWKKTAKTATEELKAIQKFMDKTKNRVDVMLRTKDADEKKFKENKIPWNAKIYTEVKIASLSLLMLYMETVLDEVQHLMVPAPEEACPERNRAIEKSMGHLTGAINFAFKTHQFAGGFTEACNAKFSEIATKTRQLKEEAASAAL